MPKHLSSRPKRSPQSVHVKTNIDMFGGDRWDVTRQPDYFRGERRQQVEPGDGVWSQALSRRRIDVIDEDKTVVSDPGNPRFINISNPDKIRDRRILSKMGMFARHREDMKPDFITVLNPDYIPPHPDLDQYTKAGHVSEKKQERKAAGKTGPRLASLAKTPTVSLQRRVINRLQAIKAKK